MSTHAPAWAGRWWLDKRQLAFAAEQVVCRALWRCADCGAFACPPVVAWARPLLLDQPRTPSDMLCLCAACAERRGTGCKGTDAHTLPASGD